MPIDASNQAQADFWAAAGAMWTAYRERFDSQVEGHGRAAIDALDPAPGETVLDIGCGAGTATAQIAQRVAPGGAVVGVDISPAMTEGAAAYAAGLGLANISFTTTDAMVEPFEPTADAIFSRFGVMFFSDATAGFANLRRALKPEGRLGFVCWQSPADNPWASTPLRVAGEFVDIPFGGDPTAPGPFSLGDPDRLRTVLADAGFVDVDISPRQSNAPMGADLEEAIGFLFTLIPPVGALEKNDPAKAEELRARLREEIGPWAGPSGVEAPSAVWIVTARQPS